jgi:hypothetical protein
VRSAATHTTVDPCSARASAAIIAALRYGVSMNTCVQSSAREPCSSAINARVRASGWTGR